MAEEEVLDQTPPIAALSGQAPFTALTASINFAGQAVGYMQNVRWNENNNLRRVNQIGSAISRAIVTGVQEFEITAQKAFLEADLMFDVATNLRFDDTQGDTTTPFAMERQTLIDRLRAGESNLTIQDKVVQLVFEIAILDAANREIVKFVDCSIQSRNVSMDQSGVIVMSDLTLMGRLKQSTPEQATGMFSGLS